MRRSVGARARNAKHRRVRGRAEGYAPGDVMKRCLPQRVRTHRESQPRNRERHENNIRVGAGRRGGPQDVAHDVVTAVGAYASAHVACAATTTGGGARHATAQNPAPDLRRQSPIRIQPPRREADGAVARAADGEVGQREPSGGKEARTPARVLGTDGDPPQLSARVVPPSIEHGLQCIGWARRMA